MSDGPSRIDIRAQVSMLDAIEMLGLDPPGRTGKVPCWFHDEDTGSLHVYDDHAHCFGCGWNGDVVWLVASITGVSPAKAMRYLAGACDELAPIAVRTVEVREPVDLTEDFAEAVTGRGPTLMDMARDLAAKRWPALGFDFALCYCGWAVAPDGIWIPYMDDGRVVGVKVRTFSGSKLSVTGSTFKVPYLSWLWPARTDTVVLCEGEPDTVAMRQRDVSAVGLPSGAGAWTAECEAFLSRFQHVVLCLDADDPGRRATDAISGKLRAAGVAVTDLAPQMERFGADVCDALAAGWVPQVSP